MHGVEAVNHELLWKNHSWCSDSTYCGFVGIKKKKDLETSRNVLTKDIIWKYFTLYISKESMPNLADFIADAIEKENTTPEDVYIILSFLWDDDDSSGGGGGVVYIVFIPVVSKSSNKKSLRFDPLIFSSLSSLSIDDGEKEKNQEKRRKYQKNYMSIKKIRRK